MNSIIATGIVVFVISITGIFMSNILVETEDVGININDIEHQKNNEIIHAIYNGTDLTIENRGGKDVNIIKTRFYDKNGNLIGERSGLSDKGNDILERREPVYRNVEWPINATSGEVITSYGNIIQIEDKRKPHFTVQDRKIPVDIKKMIINNKNITIDPITIEVTVNGTRYVNPTPGFVIGLNNTDTCTLHITESPGKIKKIKIHPPFSNTNITINGVTIPIESCKFNPKDQIGTGRGSGVDLTSTIATGSRLVYQDVDGVTWIFTNDVTPAKIYDIVPYKSVDLDPVKKVTIIKDEDEYIDYVGKLSGRYNHIKTTKVTTEDRIENPWIYDRNQLNSNVLVQKGFIPKIINTNELIPIIIPNHETFDTSDRTIDLNTYDTNKIRIDTHFSDKGTKYYVDDKTDITIFRNTEITDKEFVFQSNKYCYVSDLTVGKNSKISTEHKRTLSINFRESTDPTRCGDHPNINLDGKLNLDTNVYVRFVGELGNIPFYHDGKPHNIPICNRNNFDISTNTLKGNTKICYGKSGNDIIMVSKILAVFGVIKNDIPNADTDRWFSVSKGLEPNSPYDIIYKDSVVHRGFTSNIGSMVFDFANTLHRDLHDKTGVIRVYNSTTYAYTDNNKTGGLVFDHYNKQVHKGIITDDTVYFPIGYAKIPIPVNLTVSNFTLQSDDTIISLSYLNGNYTGGSAMYVPIIPNFLTIDMMINEYMMTLSITDISGLGANRLFDGNTNTVTQRYSGKHITLMESTTSASTYTISHIDGMVRFELQAKLSGELSVTNGIYMLARSSCEFRLQTPWEPLATFVEAYVNGERVLIDGSYRKQINFFDAPIETHTSSPPDGQPVQWKQLRQGSSSQVSVDWSRGLPWNGFWGKMSGVSPGIRTSLATIETLYSAESSITSSYRYPQQTISGQFAIPAKTGDLIELIFYNRIYATIDVPEIPGSPPGAGGCSWDTVRGDPNFRYQDARGVIKTVTSTSNILITDKYSHGTATSTIHHGSVIVGS